MSDPNTLSEKDVPTLRTKRKASPAKETLRKRKRLDDSDQPNTSEEGVSVRQMKREVREYGEGPEWKTKLSIVDVFRYTMETSSSSTNTDTGRLIM